MNWSKQQQEIFAWFKSGKGHLVVRARAGTGKTTTIIEAVSHAPERKILLAAFNKKIAVELDKRLKHPGAQAKTLHSLGFGYVKKNWPKTRIDSHGERARGIAKRLCPDARWEVIGTVCRLVSALKSMDPMIGNGPSVTQSEVISAMRVAEDFSLEIDEEEFDVTNAWVARRAIECMRHGAGLRNGLIDFDDMIWLPVRKGWAVPRFDLVVIDECQDMNRAQIDLAQMSCKKNGRIAVVGDDKQAIYGFRGADSKSIRRLLESLSAKELGLTTTYRCGKNIVREARRIVQDFQAHDGNSAGKIEKANIGMCVERALPGDFILSRTNAPLIGTCLKLLRDGKRANIEGRDVGAGLTSIIKKNSKDDPFGNMGEFLKKLEAWYVKESAAAAAKGERGESKMQKLLDQYEAILALCEGMDSPSETIERIDSLFTDTSENKGAKVILSSVHRSKGLEADRVWLLQDTFFSRMKKPPKWIDTSEEMNLEYVAITRAKELLVFVEGTL